MITWSLYMVCFSFYKYRYCSIIASCTRYHEDSLKLWCNYHYILYVYSKDNTLSATDLVNVKAMKLRTFIEDVVAYGSIGARTVESPVHRQLAASLAMPIGFKNSRSGWATQEWRHVTTGDDHYAIFKYIYTFCGRDVCRIVVFFRPGWTVGLSRIAATIALDPFIIRAMHRKNVSHLPLRFIPFASWIVWIGTCEPILKIIDSEGKRMEMVHGTGDIQSAVNAAVAASAPQKRLSTDYRGRVQIEEAITQGDWCA